MKNGLNTEMWKRAYTLIELLAVIFIVTITSVVYLPISKNYGVGAGIGAGFITIVICVLVVVQFYRWSWRRDEHQLQEVKEKYQTIFRVKGFPADGKNVRKADGAEIKIGDYGWESAPLRKDGLIYLQGLTLDWHVVWYAGFQPEQVEIVTTKPDSQYGRWRPYWAEAAPQPQCPFPILARSTATMGLPHHNPGYFESHPKRNA